MSYGTDQPADTWNSNFCPLMNNDFPTAKKNARAGHTLRPSKPWEQGHRAGPGGWPHVTAACLTAAGAPGTGLPRRELWCPGGFLKAGSSRVEGRVGQATQIPTAGGREGWRRLPGLSPSCTVGSLGVLEVTTRCPCSTLQQHGRNRGRFPAHVGHHSRPSHEVSTRVDPWHQGVSTETRSV